MAKRPFRTIPHAALDSSFARFAPTVLKSWGVLIIFDRYSEEGEKQNFKQTPRGDYAFFTGTFPEQYHIQGF